MSFRCALLLAAALALPAQAQLRAPELDTVHVGGSVGQSTLYGVCPSGFNCEDKGTSWRLFGGYQVTSMIVAELGFTKLGTARTSVGTIASDIKANAWDLSALVAWPLGRLAALGRLGLYRGERETTGDVLVNERETNLGVTYGLGAQYDLNRNLGLRADWQRFSRMGGGALGKSDVDNLSVGALWRLQ